MTTYGSTQATNSRDAADWSRGRVIRMNLRAVFGRAYPRIIGLTREPSWLFFEIFLPFLAVSAFVFVYSALEAPEEYIGFVTTLLIVFGLMLQFPVVLFVLTRLGIVTPSWLASRRRWAILIIAIVSAVATPGGDPFSMVVLALLMYGLFEATLVVVRSVQRKNRDTGPNPDADA